MPASDSMSCDMRKCMYRLMYLLQYSRKYTIVQETGHFQKEVFNPPVLVSQLDFKMQDLFPVADEPEMTGFNHSCMYRSTPTS